MTEHPILFSGAMIRAILAGTKTQTRRIVKPRHDWTMDERDDGTPWPFFEPYVHGEPEPVEVPCPYGAVSDRLWARETWCSGYARGAWGTVFAADVEFVQGKRRHEKGPHFNAEWDGPSAQVYKWRPSIFMPRWASRITLEITDVRVERVQSIGDADAQDEGLRCLSKDGGVTYKHGIPDRDGLPGADDDGWPWHDWEVDPRAAYRKLWESINGAGSWAANPWCWCLSFRRVE